jgi:hypothetical protein|eukprot:COSAG01_NODE_164_length_23340_cov_76.030033_11_plen_68_part_00
MPMFPSFRVHLCRLLFLQQTEHFQLRKNSHVIDTNHETGAHQKQAALAPETSMSSHRSSFWSLILRR